MKKYLVYVFICLSKLGLRGLLIRTFAFRPPSPPKYTLRPVKRSMSESHKSIFSTKKDMDSSKLRIHRIAGEITQHDSRPYKTDVLCYDECVYKWEHSKQGETPHKKHEINLERTRNISIFTRPFMQAYELKLISSLGKIVDIDTPDDLDIIAYYIQTQTKNTIPVVLISPKEISEYVLIYSHPNSTDIGLMLDNYLDLAYNLGVNICGYDYAGYGQSTGYPSDTNAIADIEAVYEFIVRQLGFKWNNIILYGQSIGSGPSVTLAANYRYPVGGLILHAGLASGLRIIDPGLKQTPYNDLFPNIDLLEYVNCLVYILHGQNDNLISQHSVIKTNFIYHKADCCSQNVRNLYRVWIVEDGGHNNIEYEQRFRKEYFIKLREFLREVRIRNGFYTQHELAKLYRADKWESVDHFYRERYTSTYSSKPTDQSIKYDNKSNHPTEQDVSEFELALETVTPQSDQSSQKLKRKTESLNSDFQVQHKRKPTKSDLDQVLSSFDQ